MDTQERDRHRAAYALEETIMPRLLDPRVKEQLDHAYRRMAKFYRPAAPSAGFGNIEVHPTELDLDAECSDYAGAWWAKENTGDFHIGAPSFEDRPALIYVIEAARNICGIAPGTARKLLELARL
jgi:hypothetical protein